MSGSRARSHFGRARTTHPQRDGRFFSGYRGCSQAGPSSVLSHHHRGTERSVLLRRRLQRTGTRDRRDPRSPRRRKILPTSTSSRSVERRHTCRARPGVRTGVDDRRPMSGQVRRRSRVRRPRPPGGAELRSRNPHTQPDTTPPGRATRRISATPFRASTMSCTTSCARTASKLASSNGKFSATPMRTSAPGMRDRQTSTNRSDGSTAATFSSPSRPASATARPPGPHPTSSALCPAPDACTRSILLTVPWHSDRRGARRHRAMPR